MQRFNDTVKNSSLQKGKVGEQFIVDRLQNIIGKKRLARKWYHIRHHDWGRNYNYGTGTDVTVYDDKGEPILDIEVKNWKQQPRTYGVEFTQSEILTRFLNSMAKIKLLIISFKELLTDKATDLIRSNGIKILEIGNFIPVGKSWGYAIKPFMQQNYRRLKNLLHLCSSQLVNSVVKSYSSLGKSMSIVSYMATSTNKLKANKRNYDNNISDKANESNKNNERQSKQLDNG